MMKSEEQLVDATWKVLEDLGAETPVTILNKLLRRLNKKELIFDEYVQIIIAVTNHYCDSTKRDDRLEVYNYLMRVEKE